MVVAREDGSGIDVSGLPDLKGMLEEKVDKVTTEGALRAYTVSADGEQGTTDVIAAEAKPGSIAARDGHGRMKAADPEADNDVVNKKWAIENGGIKNHSKLERLGYDESGHAGFARGTPDGAAMALGDFEAGDYIPARAIDQELDAETVSEEFPDWLILQEDDGAIWDALLKETAAREQADAAEAAARGLAVALVEYLIEGINAKIPKQANADNQLADRDFVNSSVENLAANAVTPDAAGSRPWNSLDELRAGPWYHRGEDYTPTKNDYASMINQDPALGSIDQPWRARHDGLQWIPDFPINNSTLTSDQLAAVNSGITANLVNQIALNLLAIDGITEALAGKLGITAQAADSAKLGGKAAAEFIPATSATFADDAAAASASVSNPSTLILANVLA
ncbi:MAG: hypothetical protein FWB85_01230 [Chitinispirillia bacterium]|nr:hypothetical protein [Chitinispirillia bacterium]MCL2241281.1 hypothetical protein [Chitinispirillia bacterium]